MTRARLLAAVLAIICAPPLASAQTIPPGGDERPTLTVGPVELRPRLVVHSIGVDSNVFNEAEHPKSDFTFGVQPQQQPPGWQGTSAAFWQPAGGGGRRGGGAPARGGSLRVVTTNLKPGYLRRNGVPYSANARLTEYYNRANEANGDAFLVVTTLVEDHVYLNTRWVTSTHFKKVPDGGPWTPGPCE